MMTTDSCSILLVYLQRKKYNVQINIETPEINIETLEIRHYILLSMA